MRKLLDDCFLHDRDRLRHDDAIALIGERLSPVAEPESVALADAHGRILAEGIFAPRNVPDFTNAAVDGYAFAHASLRTGETRLRVTQRVAAGPRAGERLKPGEAARIFTGAALPEGADTCIMQEDVPVHGDSVIIPAGVMRGINTRKAGEDLKAGDAAAAEGMRLRPQDVAAIASTGRELIACRRRLRVALISTGDEIVRPGRPLAPGQVYDANHHLLTGLLAAADAESIDLGIIADDEGAVRSAIARAAQDCDVILSTGGASRGEADHIVGAIQSLGTLHAWQLAVKPGRPLAMGQIADTVFFGLPGNPVAAFVTFLLYVQPMLARLQGARWQPPRRYAIPAGFGMAKKKPDRREFWRGWIEIDSGRPVLQKFARDGSGLISGLTKAEGLIEVLEETTAVAEGDLLNYIPFSEFGLAP